MEFVALIPAFNEEKRIAETVAAVIVLPDVSRVIVIDDGSTDTTAARARSAGATVVATDGNTGKGAALDRGLAFVRESDALPTGVLLLDGDLAHSAAEASHLLEPVAAGVADMSIASFPRPTGKTGFGLVKRLAVFGIQRYGSAEFSPTAPLSGQRALNWAAIDACTPFAGGYGVEVALTVRALRAGLRLVEVPTTMTHAATGRDLAGFVHRGRQFLHVAAAIIRLARER